MIERRNEVANHNQLLFKPKEAPTVCTVITLSTAVGESRRMEYQGVTIEFSRIADRLFTGFEMREGFSIATPEKALLDTLYFRKGLPVQDDLELDSVDFEMLGKLAVWYPKRVRDGWRVDIKGLMRRNSGENGANRPTL